LAVELRRDAASDVELAVGELRVARVPHADRADSVLPLLRDLGDADGFPASLTPPPVHAAHVRGPVIANLEDKPGVRTMESQAVVEAFVHQLEDARDGL